MNDVLANVKVGDKLFLKGSHYDTGRIDFVQRITPKGWIVTRAYTFYPNGTQRGGSSWNWVNARPATDADEATIEHTHKADSVSNFSQWRNLSHEQIRAIYDIVQAYRERAK